MEKQTKEPGETITLPDGRELGYLIIGEGNPVFFFHGVPSDRLDALLLKGIASSKHLKVIGVDRPGFGLSTYAPKRKIRDFAADISYLASNLGIERFALVGYSGGAHYVTTCAALLAKHITRAVVLGGYSLPPDISKMPHYERRDFVLADYADIIEVFHQSKTKISIRAVAHELRLMKKGWDVDLSQIPLGLVYIWHGSADIQASVSCAYRNSTIIPGAHLKIFENEGHHFWVNHLEELGELLSL